MELGPFGPLQLQIRPTLIGIAGACAVGELLLDVGRGEALFVLEEHASISRTRLSAPTANQNFSLDFTLMIDYPLYDDLVSRQTSPARAYSAW